MNWEECKTRRLVKGISPDEKLVRSIVEQSKKRLITDKFSPLNKDTSTTKISLNYDSLREVLEAIAIQKGFKIYGHDCFSGFIKEILKMEKESFEFDNLRKIRNSINYYGEDVDIKTAKRLIKDINQLRNKILGKLNE